MLILCSILQTSAFSTEFSGGTGEPNDPYQIATAGDLILLGESPEYYDKHFILTADIDLDPNLPGQKIFDKAVIAPDTDPAPDIYGDHMYDGIAFAGVFDGNGCTISHITITGASYLGLFGQLKSGAKISNLGLEGIFITGLYDVGGLVGFNDGIITNCYITGSVSGYKTVGGLVGVNGGTIATCYANCNVSGEDHIYNLGGLVGSNRHWITNCYANGNVSAGKYSHFLGGLVGSNIGWVANCYAIGKVSAGVGTDNLGGLTGGDNIYGHFGNCFWDIETSGQIISGKGIGKTTPEMKDPNTFIDVGWDFVGESDGPSDVWAQPADGGYPILWWQISPLPKLPFSEGTGKPKDPYLIATSRELNSIGHNPRLMYAHFKLINDIDLTGINFFIIGNELSPFTGVFDGNNHTISNFTYTSKGEIDIGLFGNVWNGEIKDLGLINPNIDSVIKNYRGPYITFGSLVGAFFDSKLTNCYVEGGHVSSSSYQYVGGLVGWNDGSITNCYTTVNVSGYESVGGLVGLNEYPGVISNSYSTGSVVGHYRIGGLVGENAPPLNEEKGVTIMNCYSTSSVSGTSSVGGLVGLNESSSIINCYSTGSVSGDISIGGLVPCKD